MRKTPENWPSCRSRAASIRIPELIFVNTQLAKLPYSGGMALLLRPLLILLTVLSLAGNAAAVPAATGVTQMVICGETGAETIWLDANGTPTEQPTDCCSCSDCLVSTAVCLPDPVSVPHLIAVAITRPPVTCQEPPHALSRLVPQPRGPPVQGASDVLAACARTEPLLRRIAHAPLDFDHVMRGQSVAGRRAIPEDARK